VKVAQRKTQTRRPATRQRGAGSGGPDALGRLNDSIEAAQAALKELRSEMSRGSRELLKDVDRTLRDARKNLGRTSRRIAKDLDELQQAAGGKRTTTARRASSSGRTTRRSSAGRSASAKK
jgi:ABC-type transporter Mla subunit MlaD